MIKEVVVESFELDYIIVKVFYVCLILEEVGLVGDIIINFDICFIQFNENVIDIVGLYIIEYFLVKLIC